MYLAPTGAQLSGATGNSFVEDEWENLDTLALAHAVSIIGISHPFYASCKRYFDRYGRLTEKQFQSLRNVKKDIIGEVAGYHNTRCRAGEPLWLVHPGEYDLSVMYGFVGGTYYCDLISLFEGE